MKNSKCSMLNAQWTFPCRLFIEHCVLSIFYLSLLLAPSARAADQIITATIVVTNTPATNDIITVNAVTKMWTNQPVSVPTTEIGITNSIGGNATNLYAHAAAFPWSSLQLTRSGTNGIALTTLLNGALTVTLSGTWGEVSYFTNTVTTLQVIRVPFTGIPGVGNRTNQAGLLVAGIGAYSPTPFPVASVAMSLFTDLSTYQELTGIKLFAGGLEMSNTLSRIIGPTELRVLTNGWIRFVEGGRLEISTNAIARFYDGALVQGTVAGVAFTNWNFNYVPDADTVVRRNDLTNMVNDLILNPSPLASATVTNLTAYGGTNSDMVLTNSIFKQSTFAQTNSFTGDVSFQQSIVTTLANGNNSGLDFGVKTYIKLKAGPSAAFTICGIQAAARDGRALIIENATGQPWTIAHQSGTDATAANRIVTPLSLDVVLPLGTTICLVYDIDISRWKLVWSSAAINTFTTTAALNFGSTLAQTSSDLTISLTGASEGDVVQLAVPSAAVNADSNYTAWVSSADTVTVRFSNFSAAPINPASGTFRVAVTKF
jgi:hypothetical protein